MRAFSASQPRCGDRGQGLRDTSYQFFPLLDEHERKPSFGNPFDHLFLLPFSYSSLTLRFLRRTPDFVAPPVSLARLLSLKTLSPPPSGDTKKRAERGTARGHNVKEKSIAVGSKMQRSDRLVRIGSSVRLCPGTGLVCNGQPYRGVHVARRSSLVASLMLQKKDWFCPKITYIAL